MVILTAKKRLLIFDLAFGSVIYWLFFVGGYHTFDFKNFSLTSFETWFWVVVGNVSIFANVIPKYLKFGGANRHFNDSTPTARKFFTKNYIRLLLHIVSGIVLFWSTGLCLAAPAFFKRHVSLHMAITIFVASDAVHNYTVWLLCRNHDGAFITRAYNVGLGIAKALCASQLVGAASWSAARPFVECLFLSITGFAGTRLFCFVTAILQVALGRDFKTMRENWYTGGLLLAQVYIMFRTNTTVEFNMGFAVAAFLFPHENWMKSRGHLRAAGMYAGVAVAAVCWATRDVRVHAALCALLSYYTVFHCGRYFKRQPMAGIDYTDQKEKGKRAEESSGGAVEVAGQPARKSILRKPLVVNPNMEDRKSDYVGMFTFLGDARTGDPKMRSLRMNTSVNQGSLTVPLKDAPSITINGKPAALPMPAQFKGDFQSTESISAVPHNMETLLQMEVEQLKRLILHREEEMRMMKELALVREQMKLNFFDPSEGASCRSTGSEQLVDQFATETPGFDAVLLDGAYSPEPDAVC